MGESQRIGELLEQPDIPDVVRRGADDPVTTPMPAITAVDTGVSCHVQEGVCVVALDGALDDGFATSVGGHLHRLCSTAEALLVDLDHLTLLEQDAVVAIVDVLDEIPVAAAMSAGRVSARLLLERWLAGRRVALFASVADALQARAFAADGYGTGWD